MREIKFRGFTVNEEKYNNGKDGWIYGNLSVLDDGTVDIQDINDENWFKAVNPETVGQYTGLKDKNGKEIYEGDILKINEDIKRAYDLEDIMYIDFIEGSFYLKAEKEIKWSMLRCLPALVNIEGNIRAEVIGNIYNNPELIGDGSNARNMERYK